MQQAWEYETVQGWKGGNFQWSSSLDSFLNEKGQQGWELVSVVDSHHNAVQWIFKRPAQTAPWASADRREPALVG